MDFASRAFGSLRKAERHSGVRGSSIRSGGSNSPKDADLQGERVNATGPREPANAVCPFCYPAGELHGNSAGRAPIMTGAPLCVTLSGHRAEQSPTLQ